MGKVVKQGETLEPCPEGLHPAVCVDVVELGLVKREWQGKVREDDMIQLRWQAFPTDPSDPERQLRTASGKPFMIVQRMKASLHPKAGLYKLLIAWRGRKFTTEELAGFDLDNVLGAPCQIQVIHNKTEGATYANIQAIVPLGRGMEKPAPVDYVRVCDRPENAAPHEEASSASGTGDDDDIPF